MACRVNELTGFYRMRTMVVKGLRKKKLFGHIIFLLKLLVYAGKLPLNNKKIDNSHWKYLPLVSVMVHCRHLRNPHLRTTTNFTVLCE